MIFIFVHPLWNRENRGSRDSFRDCREGGGHQIHEVRLFEMETIGREELGIRNQGLGVVRRKAAERRIFDFAFGGSLSHSWLRGVETFSTCNGISNLPVQSPPINSCRISGTPSR